MTTVSSMPVVGICGAGQMGAAAAVCFQRAGYRILLWERDPEKLETVHNTVGSLRAWVEQHIGPPPAAGGTITILSELRPVDEEAGVVIDCIAEVMAEKVQLFKNLPAASARETIFLTTTSGLSITELGRQSGNGPHLVGTHFWNPPHLMPLVEVIRGRETLPETVNRAVALVESI